MVDNQTKALCRLMDRFAREHWNDRFSSDRTRLSINGAELRCQVGQEVIAGHASAPLLFVIGAWGLIYAHECGGRFGHRIDGAVSWKRPIGMNGA